MTSPTIKKVSTSEQIYEILAEEMANCWWMFGEGKLAYASSTTTSYLACSICDQIGFDNSINFVPGNYISKLDFYHYLSTTNMSSKEDAKTYSEYLFGLNKEELIQSVQSDKSPSDNVKVVEDLGKAVTYITSQINLISAENKYKATMLNDFYNYLDYHLIDSDLIKSSSFSNAEVSYLDYFTKLKNFDKTKNGLSEEFKNTYLLISVQKDNEDVLKEEYVNLGREKITIATHPETTMSYLDYLIEVAKVKHEKEVQERQLEKIGGINLSKQHLIVTGIVTDQSLAGEIGEGIWQGLKLGAISAGLTLISGGTLPIAAILFGTTGSTYALVGSFLIKGDSGDPYLTPTLIEANSKELKSLNCKSVNTLA